MHLLVIHSRIGKNCCRLVFHMENKILASISLHAHKKVESAILLEVFAIFSFRYPSQWMQCKATNERLLQTLFYSHFFMCVSSDDRPTKLKMQFQRVIINMSTRVQNHKMY